MKRKIITLTICFCMLFTSGCQNWERTKKSWSSSMDGLNRRMIIYSEDGKVLKTYEGKFDLEYKDGKVKFIKDGKVHIIYIGNSSTLVIEEI